MFELSSECAIRWGHAESYLPALRYLLFDLYLSDRLSAASSGSRKRQLLTEAYLLHLLCVLDDIPAYLRDRAVLTKHKTAFPQPTVSDRILTATLRNNYALWQRTRRRAPPLLQTLIDGGGDRMRVAFLDRLGVAYMQFPLSAIDVDSQTLASRGWTIDGEFVVIKRPKAAIARPAARPTISNEQ